MSDEQPADEAKPNAPKGNGEPLTGMVHQQHGGAINRGGHVRPTQPTLADCNELARKRVYQLIPAMNRIAQNRPKRGAKKGPYSVAAQIAAFAELRRLAQDRTISESTLREKLALITAEVVDYMGSFEAAKPLLQKMAPHILEL